ncbi:MAG: hypothetical protein CL612_05750 [Anaerolineaceae bacterium]|nr:hypothetical protein [Anaerolineaceae bacterium]
MTFINQRSYIISGILVPLIIAFTLFRNGINLLDIILVLGSIAAFVSIRLLLKPTRSLLTTTDAVKAALDSDKPTLVEYQSEY